MRFIKSVALNSLTLVLIFLTISCGRFNYSPFAVNTKNTNINQHNLVAIESLPLSYPIKIALVSDTHNFYKDFDKIIDHINKKDFHFIIHGGDLTNFGRQDEFEAKRDMMKRFNRPYLTVIGNHDHLANGKHIYERMFGSRHFTMTILGVRFIFYDSNNWEAGDNIPDFPWIQNELSKATSEGLRKILVSHVPPYDEERFKPTEVSVTEQMFINNNVELSIGGHLHHPNIVNFGSPGAVHITIPSAEKSGYTELTIEGPAAGVNYQHIFL